jgi:nucleoid-associated protein YejK
MDDNILLDELAKKDKLIKHLKNTILKLEKEIDDLVQVLKREYEQKNRG